MCKLWRDFLYESYRLSSDKYIYFDTIALLQ